MNTVAPSVEEASGQASDEEYLHQKIQTQKKRIVLLFLLLVFVLIIAVVLLISLSKKKSSLSTDGVSPQPSPKQTMVAPSMTPYIVRETTPLSQPVPSIPGGVTTGYKKPENIGRLAFIRDGDIYFTDLSTDTHLYHPEIPAGDRLSWSSQGNLLAWRPKETGVPKKLVIFSVQTGEASTIEPVVGENGTLIDYAWSPDEKRIVVLIHDGLYKVLSVDLGAVISQVGSVVMTKSPNRLQNVAYGDEEAVLVSGDDGILKINPKTGNIANIVTSPVLWMHLSPNGKTIVYSEGTEEVSKLYLIGTDGNNREEVSPAPEKISMGNTGPTDISALRGLLSYAIWFPNSDKLLIAYHDKPGLPLTGMYDITGKTFTAIAPFALSPGDVMTDNLRPLGARVVTSNTTPSWQIMLFTMEDGALLSTQKVIPNAASPTFYGKEQ
jgi:hypothetical protein